MDYLSFTSLAETVIEIHAAQKAEDVWSAAVASRGETKDIEGWIRDRWGKALGQTEEVERNDFSAFLSALGNMQGGGT